MRNAPEMSNQNVGYALLCYKLAFLRYLGYVPAFAATEEHLTEPR